MCDFVLDGTHASPTRVEIGIPVLSAQNVKDGVLNYETDRYTTVKEYESYAKRFNLAEGDVLLTIVGTIGRAAVVSIVKPLVFQRSVAILRPNKEVVDSRFLFHATQSVNFKKQLSRATNQSSQAGVYLGKLKEITVELPSLPEQVRIAKILDSATRMMQKHEEAMRRQKDLYLSLQNQLFKTN